MACQPPLVRLSAEVMPALGPDRAQVWGRSQRRRSSTLIGRLRKIAPILAKDIICGCQAPLADHASREAGIMAWRLGPSIHSDRAELLFAHPAYCRGTGNSQ
jgi:hypothetical protein